MDPDPHTETAGDGGGQRVQPAVHARDLEAFRHTAEARRLEVMEADAALMMRLSVEGFEGTTWRRVAEALVEYGFTVMRSWVVTGHVFVKLREKGRPLDAQTAGIPRDDALELAEDTVAEAIVHFRDRVLKRGAWDPAKGASLTTYFIGNCLMFQFPNLYRTWRSDRAKGLRLDSMADDDRDNSIVLLPSPDDPEHEVVSRDHDQRATAEILEPVSGETNKTILRLRAEGFGVDEIAELLGLDYKAVESRIYRAREAIRARRGA
jgi:DNA-directed RNA polymerase specialized sigma24 family protein